MDDRDTQILKHLQQAIASLDRGSTLDFAADLAYGLAILTGKYLSEDKREDAEGCNYMVGEILDQWRNAETKGAMLDGRFIAIHLTAIVKALNDISSPDLMQERDKLVREVQVRLSAMPSAS